ncbi:MAG: ThiF family adenylyltransferase [archaeon]
MMIEHTNRYDRQERITGWKQDILAKATVAVLGSGALAQTTSAVLAALGIGNIVLQDATPSVATSPDEFLLPLGASELGKVESIEGVLQDMNPRSNVISLHLPINANYLPLLETPNLIFDATNDLDSKSAVWEYAARKGIHVISCAASAYSGMLVIDDPSLEELSEFGYYTQENQGILPALVLGGLAVQEARKLLMPLDESPPAHALRYSVLSTERFTAEESTTTLMSAEKKRALVIGAGSLGTPVGIGLAALGISYIDYLDSDIVETINLNRQILYYDAVGRQKAEALAERLTLINPEVRVRGMVAKLDKHTTYFEKNHPDVIIDCVDNFASRAFINYYGVHNAIPIVSGGTNPTSGQVVAYVPGKSQCLDCKLGVDRALAKELQAHSCTHAPEPSVIMTNQIIGGMMAGEAYGILSGRYAPIRKMIRYDANVPHRAGLAGSDIPCSCRRGSMQRWLSRLKT